MDVMGTQLGMLCRRYPEARIEAAPDGQRLLIVPGVPTGPGWSLERVTIRVVVPAGYPHVKLDCFYADADLRLASGAEPANSSCQPVFGATYRWFSWHVAAWDLTRDGLDQYVRFCERRFREAR